MFNRSEQKTICHESDRLIYVEDLKAQVDALGHNAAVVDLIGSGSITVDSAASERHVIRTEAEVNADGLTVVHKNY